MLLCTESTQGFGDNLLYLYVLGLMPHAGTHSEELLLTGFRLTDHRKLPQLYIHSTSYSPGWPAYPATAAETALFL